MLVTGTVSKSKAAFERLSSTYIGHRSCFDAFWRSRSSYDASTVQQESVFLLGNVSESLRILVEESDLLYSRDESFPITMGAFVECNTYADILFVQKNTYPSYADVVFEQRANIASFALRTNKFKDTMGSLLRYACFYLAMLGPKVLEATSRESSWVQKCVACDLRSADSTQDGQVQAWRCLLHLTLLELAESQPEVVFETFSELVWRMLKTLVSSAHGLCRVLNERLRICVNEFALAGVNLIRLGQMLSRSLSLCQH